MFYERILRPILFKTDPETIHQLVVGGLSLASAIKPIFWLGQKICSINSPRLIVKLSNRLSLRNPVGLAAGFDKYIDAPLAYPMLGFGWAELGSITFFEQPGNPKPRLWRLPKDKSLIVYYGLSSHGAVKAVGKLVKLNNHPIPYGISLAPTTGLALNQMADDYIKSLLTLHQFADYITLNVSCPNVAACDVFSQLSFIEELVKKVMAVIKERGINKDVFLKIGPDMENSDLDRIIDVCVKEGVTGIIATNLIKKRIGISPKSSEQELGHPGGISGKLLQDKSDRIVKYIFQVAGNKLKIIGLGGIFSAEDAYRKIKLGASAVQLITGFIYNGPLAIRNINLGLIKLLEKDGYQNIAEAVGKDV